MVADAPKDYFKSLKMMVCSESYAPLFSSCVPRLTELMLVCCRLWYVKTMAIAAYQSLAACQITSWRTFSFFLRRAVRAGWNSATSSRRRPVGRAGESRLR